MFHKILITDNDTEFLHITNQILMYSVRKFEVLNAHSASEALSILEQEMPDIVITDWEMPGKSGIELIQILKSKDSFKHIPVILCTGVMQTNEDMLYALNSGAIDFIRKPFEPFELLARINSVLAYSDVYKLYLKERDEKINAQNSELNARLLQLTKLNELLKNTAAQLRKMPVCAIGKHCKPHIDSIIYNINSIANNEKWEEFYISFEKLHPSFFSFLDDKYPDLTPTEQKICALLKLELSTKEISAITNQSLRAVEMARFRLRNKLKLRKDENIKNAFNFRAT